MVVLNELFDLNFSLFLGLFGLFDLLPQFSYIFVQFELSLLRLFLLFKYCRLKILNLDFCKRVLAGNIAQLLLRKRLVIVFDLSLYLRRGSSERFLSRLILDV